MWHQYWISVALLIGCSESSEPRYGNSSSCAPGSFDDAYDIPYISRESMESDTQTRLDIYPPEGEICDRPIVIWIHGGGWSSGDKQQKIESKIDLINEVGGIFVSVNYRLTSVGSSVQHPDHAVDIAAAIAWVRQNAPSFGGDPSRVAVFGHESGAHLAALVVTNVEYLDRFHETEQNISCVGSYDGYYDIPALIELQEDYKSVFGSVPELWKTASPSHQVRLNLPPFQLACRGSGDRAIKCEEFAQLLFNAGSSVSVIDAAAFTENETSDFGGVGAPMTADILDFLGQCW